MADDFMDYITLFDYFIDNMLRPTMVIPLEGTIHKFLLGALLKYAGNPNAKIIFNDINEFNTPKGKIKIKIIPLPTHLLAIKGSNKIGIVYDDKSEEKSVFSSDKKFELLYNNRGFGVNEIEGIKHIPEGQRFLLTESIR